MIKIYLYFYSSSFYEVILKFMSYSLAERIHSTFGLWDENDLIISVFLLNSLGGWLSFVQRSTFICLFVFNEV